MYKYIYIYIHIHTYIHIYIYIYCLELHCYDFAKLFTNKAPTSKGKGPYKGSRHAVTGWLFARNFCDSPCKSRPRSVIGYCELHIPCNMPQHISATYKRSTILIAISSITN